MKYEIKYTLHKEVNVIIDVNDNELNRQFKELGEITCDNDFVNASDPRWKMEKIAYDDFRSCSDNVDYSGDETIVDVTIKCVGK